MSDPNTKKVEVHGGKERHVQIPEGWKEVTEGKAQKYDMFYNLGSHRFTLITPDDYGDDHVLFNLLIREDTPEGWTRVKEGYPKEGDRFYCNDNPNSFITITKANVNDPDIDVKKHKLLRRHP